MENREALRARFVPPDGGYGWFVAFGAFLAQFWMAGLIKSYGIIFMEVMQLYPGASAALASWIPAILSTLSLVLSPVCSALCQRFTCRSVVFTGGLLCWLGVSLSFFATSLQQLCLTFGVLTGFGAGLVMTPGIIMTSRYFDKHRGFANGLCVSGTAVGSMLIPPLMEALLPTYGFRGSILILGACMLHICLSAALYRPFEVHQAIVERDIEYAKGDELPKAECNDSHPQPDCHLLNIPEGGVSVNCKPLTLISEIDLSHKSTMFHNVDNLSTDSTALYIENLAQSKSTTPDEFLSDTGTKSRSKTKETKCCLVNKYIDFSLIQNPLFLLLASTVMLMAVGCPQALFFLPSYANSVGLEKSECSLLLSVSAVFDLAGRLGLGYIADLNFFSKYKAYSLSMLTSGIAVLCVPFATTFYAFAAIVAFYGIGLGSWMLLVSVLLSEHHGTESIGSSYGLIRLFQGMMSLIVPPLVGYSKDATGDYDIGFFSMGIAMSLGAIIILFKPCVIRWQLSNRNVP